MLTQLSVASDSDTATSRAILQHLTRDLGPRSFSVRFWDGTVWGPTAGQPAHFTLVLNHRGSLRKMLWPPNDLSVGEAFVYGDYDVEGDMVAFVAFMRRLGEQGRGLGERMRLGWRLWRLPVINTPRSGRGAARLRGTRHSLQRDRQAVEYHYDVSNDFFGLFLDPRMVYTCAYYRSPDDDLATAQEQKLDYLCRKLRLKAGERLLDIGCGWGGLATFAARNYGAQVTGVTLSRAQTEFARDQIIQQGLEGRCRVECRDFRELPDDEQFDKIVTVEVLEHMNEALVKEYFRKVGQLLRPGGVLVIQAITLTGPTGMTRWRQFNQRYVFPDGELRPVSVIQREGEAAGFEVRDVQSLREHYARTLQFWLKALENQHDLAVQYTDEATYRTFRMYLAGAQLGYISGVYNVHEVMMVKPNEGRSGLPLTRAEWAE